MQPSVVTAEDLERRLAEAFPVGLPPGQRFGDPRCLVSRLPRAHGVRCTQAAPGRHDLLGPNLMLLAGVAMYVAVLASIGWQAARRDDKPEYQFPAEASTWCVASRMPADQLGRRLAVGDIGIRSEAGEDLVAHATSTYSIPPNGEVL